MQAFSYLDDANENKEERAAQYQVAQVLLFPAYLSSPKPRLLHL